MEWHCFRVLGITIESNDIVLSCNGHKRTDARPDNLDKKRPNQTEQRGIEAIPHSLLQHKSVEQSHQNIRISQSQYLWNQAQSHYPNSPSTNFGNLSFSSVCSLEFLRSWYRFQNLCMVRLDKCRCCIQRQRRKVRNSLTTLSIQKLTSLRRSHGCSDVVCDDLLDCVRRAEMIRRCCGDLDGISAVRSRGNNCCGCQKKKRIGRER